MGLLHSSGCWSGLASSCSTNHKNKSQLEQSILLNNRCTCTTKHNTKKRDEANQSRHRHRALRPRGRPDKTGRLRTLGGELLAGSLSSG
jgi:hypothetical protein